MPTPADPTTAGSWSFRTRVGLVFGVIGLSTVLAWSWVLSLATAYPVLIGLAALAYGLGLRHALDADHIAAIDNVTRRLTTYGQRPAGVGFFFSVGHSTIVALATVGAALAASRVKAGLRHLQDVGGWIGTAVSTGFLLLVGGPHV